MADIGVIPKCWTIVIWSIRSSNVNSLLASKNFNVKTIPFLKVFPSQANYFLCKVSDKYSSRELAVRLFDENVLIKDCSTKAAFNGRNYIRLAVRNHTDNLRVIQVLRKL